MRAGETLKGKDNKEVMLFPLEYLNMSQDEGGDYSHEGTYNMDFLGWGASGRVLECVYYAPCSCKLVYQSKPGAYNIWESIEEVHTPGGLTKLTFMMIHDNHLPFNVGDIVYQGEAIGRTGTAGQATGDHLHYNIAVGTYEGQEQVPPNYNWQLKNSYHIYDLCYVNDTVIVNGYGHNFRIYENGGGGGSSTRKNKFKWVLYANKLRNIDK